jgi:hypothetical protein
MRLLIKVNGCELEVQGIERLKEHMQHLNELITIYENTDDEVVFNIPNDILKKMP